MPLDLAGRNVGDYPSDLRGGAGVKVDKTGQTAKLRLELRDVQQISTVPTGALLGVQDPVTGALMAFPAEALVGEQGPVGAGIVIKGDRQTPSALPVTGAPGDTYLIRTSNTAVVPPYYSGDGFAWTGTGTGVGPGGNYTNVGQIQGPQGAPSTQPGPPGPPGLDGAATFTRIATARIFPGSGLVGDGLSNAVRVDPTNPDHRGKVIGITRDGAFPGEEVTGQLGGDMAGVTGAFAAGDTLTFALNGTLTKTLPDNAVWRQTVGVATTSSRIVINLGTARLIYDGLNLFPPSSGAANAAFDAAMSAWEASLPITEVGLPVGAWWSNGGLLTRKKDAP